MSLPPPTFNSLFLFPFQASAKVRLHFPWQVSPINHSGSDDAGCGRRGKPWGHYVAEAQEGGVGRRWGLWGREVEGDEAVEKQAPGSGG